MNFELCESSHYTNVDVTVIIVQIIIVTSFGGLYVLSVLLDPLQLDISMFLVRC